MQQDSSYVSGIAANSDASPAARFWRRTTAALVTALSALVLSIIGWQWGNIHEVSTEVIATRSDLDKDQKDLVARIAVVESELRAHEAAQEIRVKAEVTRGEHDALRNQIGVLEVHEASDRVHIEVDAHRLDVIEEQIRTLIDGDFRRPSPHANQP